MANYKLLRGDEKMRKGIVRIVVGVILVLLQIMSMVGNASAGNALTTSMATSYSAGHMLGYYMIGIIGLALLIWGIVAFNKSKNV